MITLRDKSTVMKYFFLSVILIAFVQCKQKPPPFGVEFVSVDQAREIIHNQKDLKILDVRTEEEAAEGMLDDAVVIDIRKDDFEQQLLNLNKSDTYLVYCRSGRRSTAAVEKMAELGFDRVYMMEGGYLDWVDSED